MSIRIESLYVYPIKSCAGIRVPTLEVRPHGPLFDREWMVTTEDGVFVAQRGGSRDRGVGVRSLCRVRPRLTPTHLVVDAPRASTLRIPLDAVGPARSVRVWGRRLEATDAGGEAADWFTEVLSRERPGRYRLVRIRRDRPDLMGFVDDAELLIAGRASLDDLNGRLDPALDMDRFRPSIVLEGLEPYQEDALDAWSVGGLRMEGGNLCTRCPITMIDQETGEQGHEPLRTLATYRRTPKGVAFGRYATPGGVGRLEEGDAVVVERWAARGGAFGRHLFPTVDQVSPR